ncbi:hypothetical protein EJ110_NYTH19952 [Nymphaea thermarum]|nr:hypothetical protein EJ110_NYTH19952 [Nymphaea thermarum]
MPKVTRSKCFVTVAYRNFLPPQLLLPRKNFSPSHQRPLSPSPHSPSQLRSSAGSLSPFLSDAFPFSVALTCSGTGISLAGKTGQHPPPPRSPLLRSAVAALKGRGRGRGWWPGSAIGGGRALGDEDFALFPKIEGLPPIRDLTDEEKFLIDRKRHFASWCKNSPYFIKDRSLSHDTLAPDVEMYSDMKAKETVRRATLLDCLILTPSNFPVELIEDLHHMDSLLAKLKDDGKDDADEDEEAEQGDKKRKKGDEDEDEGEENDNLEEEEDDEAIGADDYTENFGFDDDEDFLDGEDDGGNDEPTYE